LVSKKDFEVVAHLFASESMNDMLAYVFWHWPTSTANSSEYTSDLIKFHTTLQVHSIPGFHFSHIFHLDKAPWIPQNLLLCEDWYLMENSAVLDTLNLVAVSAARKAPHDQVAHNAAGGIAGLYRLCAGEVDPTRVHIACWFDKPVGMTYEAFFALMLPLIPQSEGTLWQRQMVLGPTPEFCWWAPTSPSLPNSICRIMLALTQIWSGMAMKWG
jgi:hypothetical protein